MFDKIFYATHPDMMECVSNEELRDRYLISNLFRDGECVLNYTHADRFVIGGISVKSGSVQLPAQSEPPSAVGHPFLERRELAIVNVGNVEGLVTVDGESFTLGNKDCLYVTMGASDVQFSGDGARFYLASCPAHKAFTTRKLSIADANALERGSLDLSARNSRDLRQCAIGYGAYGAETR
jgi:4-deoxy-L-threo-5-hexosulose-uronate ketol-isomerase